MTVVWIFMSLRARKGYLRAFRQSIERRDVVPAEVRLSGGDLSTIETLVQELAQPDPARVVYAIDMLESLDKRNLVTPLLLYHESPTVRQRALRALGAVRSDISVRWLPQVRRMLGDADSGVRAAAIVAIGAINNEDATTLSRPLLADPDPRIRVTAAVALAASASPADVDAAEAVLVELAGDSRDAARDGRRDVAAAIRHIADPRFRRLLIPLLYDTVPGSGRRGDGKRAGGGRVGLRVRPDAHRAAPEPPAEGARPRRCWSATASRSSTRSRTSCSDAEEDIWVRRHIPATLAQIPSQQSVDVLTAALSEPDGFLRYKVIAALDRLRRTDDPLTFPRDGDRSARAPRRPPLLQLPVACPTT